MISIKLQGIPVPFLYIKQGIVYDCYLSKLLNKNDWIVDTGASDHMTGSLCGMMDYKRCEKNIRVTMADGAISHVEGEGSVYLDGLLLKSVLYVPSLKCNLLSISKATRDMHCKVTFSPTHCVFHDLISGRMIGNAKEREGLYYVQGSAATPVFLPRLQNSFVSSTVSDSNIYLWHKRLGHLNFRYLKILYPHLFSNNMSDSFDCEECILAKQTKSSHPIHAYQPTKPFYIIHGDVWGATRLPNLTNTRWFVIFMDDHTRVCWVFLMKEKSEVFKLFKNFHQMVLNNFQTSIHILHSDNGKEYFSSEFETYLRDNGIIHQSTCPYNPQQNGIAKRKNRHLLETARTLMFSSSVPTSFWGEAVLTTAYLINRLPTKILNFKTPLNTLITSYPLLTRMLNSLSPKIFGCTAFVQIIIQNCILSP